MDIIPNPKEVGERIRNIRKSLGLSMDAFAARIDEKAKSGTVSNWETGKNLPNNERLKRIAELGNTSISSLLYGNTQNFIRNNLRRLLPEEYEFLSESLSNEHVDFFVNEIEHNKVSIFEIEKIRSIINNCLLNLLPEIEISYKDKVNFIAKNKNYKDQVIEQFISDNKFSKSNKEKINQIKFIFKNADNLTVKNLNLFPTINIISEILESIINNNSLISVYAFLIEENTFIKKIEDIDFINDQTLEMHQIYIKQYTKPFPNPENDDYFHLLVKLKSEIPEYANKGDYILVDYFPNLDYEIIIKFLLNKKLAIIHNNKIYIGNLNEDLTFKTANKTIKLDEENLETKIFPLLAIFY